MQSQHLYPPLNNRAIISYSSLNSYLLLIICIIDFLPLSEINEADLNDTLSDFEDSSGSPFSSLSLSLDGKLSEASFCTTESVLGRYVASAPLAASLFPHVPPYISFASHSKRGPEMPPSIHKVLKWKLTTITPIVIRKVLINTGFRLLRSKCGTTCSTTIISINLATWCWMKDVLGCIWNLQICLPQRRNCVL